MEKSEISVAGSKQLLFYRTIKQKYKQKYKYFSRRWYYKRISTLMKDSISINEKSGVR